MVAPRWCPGQPPTSVPGVSRPGHLLDLDAVGLEVGDAVGTGVAPLHDEDPRDAGVVEQLAAHHAGLARDDEPGAAGGHPVGRGVADDVHLGVVTADLHAGARLDALAVAEADVAATEVAAAAGATVVAIHEDDVAVGVEEQRAEGAAGAVRGLGQGEALLDADPNVVRLPSDRRTVVVGDLHGSLADLVKIFDLMGWPGPENNFIFNGDFVDRGERGIEIIATLFSLKIVFPLFDNNFIFSM